MMYHQLATYFYQKIPTFFGKKYWLSFTLILFSNIFLTACQSLSISPHLAKSQNLSQQSLQLQKKLTNNKDLLKKISKNTPKNNHTLSGYYPIITSFDAYHSRHILTKLAKHSIDIQYYIWHNDASGQLMLKKLYESANRGVKVRLLLDDLDTTPQFDQTLLNFSKHQNIAVRLINPKNVRSLTPLNFATAMPRYHRRMHNKSMTFDKQISIIGGRNIGDEYLRSDNKNEFSDLDILLAGKVVNAINDSFEQYWHSDLSYDIEVLVKNNPQQSADFLQSLDKIKHQNALAITQNHQNPNTLDHLLNQGRLNLRWAKIDFFADNVKKLSKKDKQSERLVSQLREAIGTPKQDFTVISSYFVPTRLGVMQLKQLVENGVNVTILTNSFQATDVPIVHSGYLNARLPMLQAGVKLYELKPSVDADLRQKKSTLNKQDNSTSLHTKAFAVDDRLAFIGSYNLDPRSANINTELGVVIYDKALARAIHQMFDDKILNISYRLDIAQNRLVWQTLEENNSVIILQQKEPNLSLVNRLWLNLFAVLPITWLL